MIKRLAASFLGVFLLGVGVPPAHAIAQIGETRTSDGMRMTVTKNDSILRMKAELALTGIASLDRDAAAYVEAVLKDFENQTVKDCADWQKNSADLGEFRPYELVLTGSIMPSSEAFAEAFAAPVAVLQWEIYSYTGGAHGSTLYEFWNYDRATGKRLVFDDLFARPRAALEILSVASRSLLGAQDVDREMLMAGTEPTLENFATVAVVPDGLRVRFQQYQVGPYVLGAPEVTVPLAALKPAEPRMEYWQSRH